MVKDLIREWLEMLDVRHPGWAAGYDREAFELAAADVFDDVPLNADVLEALGGFLEADADLDLGPDWRRRMIEFEYIFRASHRPDASLRVMRAETLRRLVEAARDPAARRLEGIARAFDAREKRRRMSKLPDGLGDAREARPEWAAQAREAAWRTSLRAARDLSPAALGALRAFLGDAEGRPASAAAREAGISPATMSRALRRVAELAREELEDCPDAALRPFLASLMEFLGGLT